MDSIHMNVDYILDTSDHEENKDLLEFLAAISEEPEIHTTIAADRCFVCVQIRYYTHLFPAKLRALFDRMTLYINRLCARELEVNPV